MTSKPSLVRRSFSAAVLLVIALAGSSCSKDIRSTEVLPALTPANADASAGSWKMIVLSGPTQVPVPRPRRPAIPAINRSSPPSSPRKPTSPMRKKPPSPIGAAAASCAGTKSCANSWHAPTSRPHQIPTEATPFQIPQTPSRTRNTRSAIRPTPRVPTATSPSRSSKRSRPPGTTNFSTIANRPSKWTPALNRSCRPQACRRIPPKTPSKQPSTPPCSLFSFPHPSTRSTPRQPNSNKPPSSPVAPPPATSPPE